MAIASNEGSLVKRFHLQSAPTLTACISSAAPIAFSRMRNEHAQPGRSISPRPEEAFTFQVPLIRASFSDLRYEDRRVALPEVQEPGRAFIFDLSASPTVGLGTEFDNIRLYISQKTMNDLAYERGLPRVGGLRQRTFGERDPILFHLAHLLVPALDQPGQVSAAFMEYIGLAFHEHIITTYAGVRDSDRKRRSASLAPWQIRDALDYIEANLGNNPSISDLARHCNLSPSYFARAFRDVMHMPPHQWLLFRRIERAKELLRDTDASLVDIAADCGFSDQSHLSRVFGRIQGCSPREWRRCQRS